jgi:YycE-like protein
MKMQVRFARHTDRLTDIVGFYRDGLGLPEIGRFENHDGYDGVFLAVPGTDAQLEFTSGGHGRRSASAGVEEPADGECERMPAQPRAT